MTPDKRLEQVEVASVRKKMKRVDFARNVNREEIVIGAAELGVDLDEHIVFVRDAMIGIHAELGL
jgi:predicted hydrolase (HD superfamily)